jgi:hypothetical protein
MNKSKRIIILYLIMEICGCKGSNKGVGGECFIKNKGLMMYKKGGVRIGVRIGVRREARASVLMKKDWVDMVGDSIKKSKKIYEKVSLCISDKKDLIIRYEELLIAKLLIYYMINSYLFYLIQKILEKL